MSYQLQNIADLGLQLPLSPQTYLSSNCTSQSVQCLCSGLGPGKNGSSLTLECKKQSPLNLGAIATSFPGSYM